MDTTEKLNHLSLCTGYGGIDLGLGRALGNVRTVAYVEIEAFAVENLVAKVERGLLDVAPVWSNLKTFAWSEFRGRVDILSGGFPCQPFSAAGQRAGDEDPRHLWPYIVRGIRELGRPPLIFLENVEGIISSKLKSDQWSDPEGTPVLLHVLRELERLGYDATTGVFSAREVGAPHQRKRVFIMGVRSDLGQSGRDLVSGMLRDTESVTPLAYAKSVGGGRECRTMGDAERDKKKGSVTNGSCKNVGKMGDTNDLGCRSRTLSRFSDQKSDGRRETKEVVCSDIERAGRRAQDADYLLPEQIFRGEPDITSAYGSGFTDMDQYQSTYPAPRGAEQYIWEPPRTTTEIKPAMGRNLDGVTDRVDYAQLCESVDNRTDELRLLGNGVVPDIAERAFRVLWQSLAIPYFE